MFQKSSTLLKKLSCTQQLLFTTLEIMWVMIMFLLCSGIDSQQVLKPACVNALKRIFKLCDMNKDGVLDQAELNEFQVTSVVLIFASTDLVMCLAQML
jgi:hypothetical protein